MSSDFFYGFFQNLCEGKPIMQQTICALCGLTEQGFDYKGKIGKRERMEHLRIEHRIVNIPSQQWMSDSKKIFVLLPEQDIDEQASELD